MSAQAKNRAVVLKSYVGKGNKPTKDHFQVIEAETPVLQEGEILLQTLYVSVDPYMRMRMNPGKSYLEPFQEGKPLNGSGVGVVKESKNPKYVAGDVLTSQKRLAWPFQNYVVFDDKEASQYTKLDMNTVPKTLVSATIGFLGMPGLTAYFGLLERGNPKQGETLVVSGAAGACGSVVGQIAKIKGLKSVGIVGDQVKAEYITKEMGYDAAIVYKDKSQEQIEEEVRKLCPNGVDIYYDNVGGDISKAVLRVLNKGARVPICGQISQYNSETPEPLPEDIEQSLKDKEVSRAWFMVFEFFAHFDRAWAEMFQWVQEGKFKNKETVYEGIENVSTAFLGLFSGENIGKAVIKFADL